MRRREFITLVGGAAVSWPLAARGQQPAMPVIGFLHGASPVAWMDQLRGFHRGLKDAGFVESENVAIVYRWAEGQYDRLPALVADLTRRQLNVLVAITTLGALAAKAATTTIPVFLSAEDPVTLGLVASLARPGGNLTGINFFGLELAAKRLELLRELVPAATRVAVLVNPANPVTAEPTVRGVETAARAMGLQIQVHNASNSREIDAALSSFARDRPDALYIGAEQLFTLRGVQLVQSAARLAIPAIYSGRQFTNCGGLMSYAADITDAYRQVGVYTGRILKGAKPADLPVEQSSKFELVINHQTARMLGITVPDKLLATADEVIE